MKKLILKATTAVVIAATLSIPAINVSAYGLIKSVSLVPVQSTPVTAPQQAQPAAPTPAPAPVVTQPTAPTQPTSNTTGYTQPARTSTLNKSVSLVPTQPAPTTQPPFPAPTTQQPAPVQQPTAPTQPTTTPTAPSSPVTSNPSTGGLTTTVNSSRLTKAQVDAGVMEMLELMNNARIENGLKPLILDQQITQVAQVKSEDMVKSNYFSHISPNYGSVLDMYKTFGVKYVGAGENIARSTSVRQAFINLMNSPGHKKNILQPKFTHVGIGIDRHPSSQHGGRYVVTQMFANK